MATQAEAAVSARPVQNAVDNLVLREDGLLSSLTTVTSSISTAADYLTVLGDTEKVAAYKELMLSLGKLTHEIKTHQDVLKQLKTSYEPSAEPTDFRGLLESSLAASLSRQPYEPRSDQAMREFVTGLGEDPDSVLAAAAGGAGGSGGAAAGGGSGAAADEDDADEDVVEAGGAGGRRGWQNDKCPLSLKNVLDLEVPVQDPVGYVYDKAAVLEWLRRTRGRAGPGGAAQTQAHPVAGCSHFLHESQLLPARAVEREQRRRRLREAMGGGAAGGGGGGGGAGAGGEEDVIDV
ncbi:hypothetical protein HYH02_013355 [Chlamydomonas schloesseri]|uniref:U-box domain-containing protein n=1 Tax=Chlamydomonas schloesseri TaxID=2026947 RepID=A0A835W062_9CHLO|nr:hypothetical protein HYH02_013355 [Chlamydomonas schloesseri]|eukprot:KAG2431366.1 hypothetical protein HYH02_013355 [Chlamydomonas schloesseri]